MTYVDGFVVAVQTAKKTQYLNQSKKAVEAFIEYGALSVMENWGVNVPDGKVTSFPMAVKLKPTETVVFSWVTWPSKAVRDAGWEKLMTDPRMQPGDEGVPFDGERLIFGEFETILSV